MSEECPVCGCKDGHHVPTNGTIGQEPLTKDDWEELYHYVQKQQREQLTFVHELISKAKKRDKAA